MDLVVGLVALIERLLAHQLHNRLKGPGGGDVAGTVARHAAHNQVLRPVHVLGGEAEAAAGEGGANLLRRGALLVLRICGGDGKVGIVVGRRAGTVWVRWVQTGLRLVPGGDAAGAHKLEKGLQLPGGGAAARGGAQLLAAVRLQVGHHRADQGLRVKGGPLDGHGEEAKKRKEEKGKKVVIGIQMRSKRKRTYGMATGTSGPSR